MFLSLLGGAQELSVKGKITDKDNNPIAYANVVLELKKNQEAYTGTITDHFGHFVLEHISPGTYVLKVSYLGYVEFSKELQVKTSINLNPIILEERLLELDGVTIVAKKPTVTRLVDRLVFNVENSTLSNSNALDVLKHTPGVLVSGNTITVKQSEPIIYINDRRVHLSMADVQQLLEGTSATNIKSIEVITNPPAKYEAEGGAVLNIVTSKHIVAGYNGSVFGNFKQGSKYPKYSLGTSHYFKTEKLSTYFNYNISPRKDYRNNDEYVNFIENDQIETRWETDFKRTRKSANQNINGYIDYAISDNDNLGFSTNILLSPRENSKTFVDSKTDVFDANHVKDSSFITTNRLVEETFNFAFTLDYTHKFKKEGEKLSLNVHHTNYDFSNFQNVDTDYLWPDETLIRSNRFQTFSSRVIKIYTGQADYVLPISGGVFEAGAKFSNINSESILEQYAYEDGEKYEDLENSDTFLYDENNYAVYASFSKEWDTWSLKLGARNEFTDVESNSLTTGLMYGQSYMKFFPSVHLQHNLNENHQVYFNYNKRIYRPRYRQVNPFKYFLNDIAYITGDPNLKPQIDDNFVLGYTLNQTFNFEVYYRFENNPAIEILFQDNEENILKYINTNIDKSISYGLDFSMYTSFAKNWNVYLLSSLFYYDNYFFASESNNVLRNNSKWSVYAQMVNYFSFLKDKSLNAEASLLYISPFADGPAVVSDRFGLDITIRKSFWQNKASLNMGVTDIFNTQNFSRTTKYLNQDAAFNSKLENRLFVLGFNYKFGNTKLKVPKKKIEIKERERLGEDE